MFKEIEKNPAEPSFREILESVYGVDSAFKHSFNSWLAGHYELNVAALNYLGFGEQDGIPAFEQVRDAVRPGAMVWLARRAFAGHQDELSITPLIQSIGLVGSKAEPGLVKRIDARKKWYLAKNRVEDIWKLFDDKDPRHDNYAHETFPVGFLLGDISDPRDKDSPNVNYVTEPGLVYPGIPVTELREAFADERSLHAKDGRILAESTPAQIVLSSIKRRLEDKPQMKLHTLLPQYGDTDINRAIGGIYASGQETVKVAPSIHIQGKKNPVVVLTDERVDEPLRWQVGMRRSLRVPVEAELEL